MEFALAKEIGIPITSPAIGKAQLARPIRLSDMASLTNLDLSNLQLTTIEGLQYASNLRTLNLANNFLTDLTR